MDLDEYSDDDSTRTVQKKSKKEQQEEKLEEIVTELKGKHGKNYTTMQYRIWGEMVGSDFHSSLDSPPKTSMFVRAGGETPKSRKDQGVAQALSLIANQITSPTSETRPARTREYSISESASPAKMIENRSKCYQQLTELHSMKSAGVLTESEYQEEKQSVVQTLKSLAM